MGPHFSSKNVHDHINGINEHPVALGQALDSRCIAFFLETPREVLSNCSDVPLRPASRHDHKVGHWIAALEIYGDRIGGLIRIERAQDEL